MASQMFRLPNSNGQRFRFPNDQFNGNGQMYGFPNNQFNPEEIFDKFWNMVEKTATVNESSAKWGKKQNCLNNLLNRWVLIIDLKFSETATIIACAISITAVVIRWLMKKEDTGYSPIHRGVRNQVSDDQNIVVNIPVVQPETETENMSSSGRVRDVHRLFRVFQFLGENMKRFLQNKTRERQGKFSHQDINEFTGYLSSSLGSDWYGEVYKGSFPNRVAIVVKVLKDNLSDKKREEQFMAVVGTLVRIEHVNLVKLYGFCFDHKMRALVYEYMENRSLAKLLFDENKQQVEWEKLFQIVIGVAKGLAYLHEDCQPTVIHYNIRPQNILLDSNLNPKIADLGLASLCSNSECWSGDYDAPELLKEKLPVTNKCDVYSFGLLLLEIIGRRRNINRNESNNDIGVVAKWTRSLWEKGKLTNFFSECHIEEKNQQEAERMLMVLFLCIHNDPNKRPNMSNVVKMLEGEIEVINRPTNPFASNGKTSVLHDEIKEKSMAALEIELVSPKT